MRCPTIVSGVLAVVMTAACPGELEFRYISPPSWNEVSCKLELCFTKGDVTTCIDCEALESGTPGGGVFDGTGPSSCEPDELARFVANPEPPSKPPQCGGDGDVLADDGTGGGDAGMDTATVDGVEPGPDAADSAGDDTLDMAVDDSPDAGEVEVGPDGGDSETDASLECAEDCDQYDTVCEDFACVAGACEGTFATAVCDDLDPCTENDVCDAGTCAGVVMSYDAVTDWLAPLVCAAGGPTVINGIAGRSDGGAYVVAQHSATSCDPLQVGPIGSSTSHAINADGSTVSRINADGSINWSQAWPGFSVLVAGASPAGSVAVGGWYDSPTSTLVLPASDANGDAFVQVMTATSTPVWGLRVFSASDDASVTGIAHTDLGFTIVAGETGNGVTTTFGDAAGATVVDTLGSGTEAFVVDAMDTLIVRVSPEGQAVDWLQLSGEGEQVVGGLARSPSGEFVVAV